MKRISFHVICFLSLCLTGFAQAPSAHYSISIGTFNDVQRDEFARLEPFGFLYSLKKESNYSEVFLGGYSRLESARAALDRVIAAGYSDAALREVPESQGVATTVIQIAALDSKKTIDWKRFNKFTNLLGIPSDNAIKLVVGPYNNAEEAKKALPMIQKEGFNDAFTRSVNSVHLIKLGAFETGNAIKTSPPNFPWLQSNSKKETPTDPKVVVYSSVNPPQTQTKTPVTPHNASVPEIRGNVKRRSVLELQKMLKAEKHYSGSLDGYYGNETARSYQAALEQNKELSKYRILVMNRPSAQASADGDELQQAINRLEEDARASIMLESFNHPIAKAYRAYHLFATLGPGNEVNNLMNNAIREAYVSRSTRLLAPFDYQATYAYNDIQQLILHLHYLHIAPGVSYSVPCWLSKAHPGETGVAQKALAGTTLKTQLCDGAFDWEEIKMLENMSVEIGGKQASSQVLAEANATRSALALAARPLSSVAKKEIETWQNTVFEKLTSWAATDLLHQNKYNAFRILYFQGAVRLEDYFMNKGLTAEEAKFLAMAALRTIVGPNMERFQ